MIAARGVMSEFRLPKQIAPSSYYLELQPFLLEGRFKGKVKINITWQDTTNEIVLHAHQDLEIINDKIKITQYSPDNER